MGLDAIFNLVIHATDNFEAALTPASGAATDVDNAHSISGIFQQSVLHKIGQSTLGLTNFFLAAVPQPAGG